MDCLILAGGRPTIEDPLYKYSKGEPKALIDVAGKKMITWIIEAMIDAKSIDRITVVGIDPLPEFNSTATFLPDEGSLIDNLSSGFSWIRNNRPNLKAILLSSSDIPTVNGAIVDQVVEECQSSEIAVHYPVVTRETMAARYPTSKRTFVRLSDVEVAGGDLIVVHQQAFDIDLEFWRSITNARKHAWRIARIVGTKTLYKLLTRRLTLAEAEKKGEEIVGHPVRAYLSSLAEIAMDVDKPEQLLAVSEELRSAQELT